MRKLLGLLVLLVFTAPSAANVDDLIKKLGSKDSDARRSAANDLMELGKDAKPAAKALTAALKDSDRFVRRYAARALGNIGPDAKAALTALKKAEKDEDANVRQVAQAAAVQIRSDANLKEFQVQGVLSPGDPFDRVRKSCYHVVHAYPMKAGQRYTIDLISAWDNYLRLEDAQGKQLAEDDDGGGFPNARILFTAPNDGWYRIIVTSYAQGASGSYTLKVR